MKLTETVDLSRSEWEQLIDEWIFDEEHRQILKLNLLDGKGYDYLSFKFNYSNRQIARILQKSKEKLSKHVKKAKQFK